MGTVYMTLNVNPDTFKTGQWLLMQAKLDRELAPETLFLWLRDNVKRPNDITDDCVFRGWLKPRVHYESGLEAAPVHPYYLIDFAAIESDLRATKSDVAGD